MSAPLKLTAEQMRRLASALDAMTAIKTAFDVSLSPFGQQYIGVDDNTLAFNWDEYAQAYQIDDRNGS